MVFRLPGDEPSLLSALDASGRNPLLQPAGMGRQVAYASQFETLIIVLTEARPKSNPRLIADLDPDEWDLPPKPKWMRWRTY